MLAGLGLIGGLAVAWPSAGGIIAGLAGMGGGAALAEPAGAAASCRPPSRRSCSVAALSWLTVEPRVALVVTGTTFSSSLLELPSSVAW